MMRHTLQARVYAAVALTGCTMMLWVSTTHAQSVENFANITAPIGIDYDPFNNRLIVSRYFNPTCHLVKSSPLSRVQYTHPRERSTMLDKIIATFCIPDDLLHILHHRKVAS